MTIVSDLEAGIDFKTRSSIDVKLLPTFYGQVNEDMGEKIIIE